MVNPDENNPKINVLFLWDVPDPLKEYLYGYLNHVANLNLIFLKESTPAEFLKWAPSADVMIGWRPTKELLNHAQKLKVYNPEYNFLN